MPYVWNMAIFHTHKLWLRYGHILYGRFDYGHIMEIELKIMAIIFHSMFTSCGYEYELS